MFSYRLAHTVIGSAMLKSVTSLAFHSALGFEQEGTAEDYDGAGASRVLLARKL